MRMEILPLRHNPFPNQSMLFHTQCTLSIHSFPHILQHILYHQHLPHLRTFLQLQQQCHTISLLLHPLSDYTIMKCFREWRRSEEE